MKRVWAAFFILVTVVLSTSLLYAAHVHTIDTFAGAAGAAAATEVLASSYGNHSAWVSRVSKFRWQVKETPDEEIVGAVPGTLVIKYPQDTFNADILAEKKGHFVSIMAPAFAMQIDCGFNFGGMTVGYFTRAELQFIDALIAGYRMDRSKIKLVKISQNQVFTLPRRLQRDLNIVIAFVVPKSPFHRLLQAQRVSILGFNRINIERVKVFYPSITVEETKLRSLFFDIGGTGAMVLARENDTKLPTINCAIARVKPPEKPKTVLDPFSNYEPEAKTVSPTYRCYGDETIVIRGLCESPFDAIGMPKQTPTTWDDPWTKDDDCPFYDGSQRRGGCDTKTGLCELPVAVKRLGYRLYDDKGVNEPFKRDGKYIFPSSNG